jgi:Leucine-rich repeat (LRR) protein
MEKKAFTDLPRLRRLKLRGNRIAELNPETFQNLPELEELDIAYNKLTSLDLSSLDQVIFHY